MQLQLLLFQLLQLQHVKLLQLQHEHRLRRLIAARGFPKPTDKEGLMAAPAMLRELHVLESETFELEELPSTSQDVMAWTSSSCSCSSCCSCSTSSCSSCSTSTSSCG